MIYQAPVRRDIVVQFIDCMKVVAMAHTDMSTWDKIARKQKQVPVRSVPPDMIQSLPSADLLDHFQMQKSATPVSTPDTIREAADILEVLRPNVVALGRENSSHDEIDIC